MAGVDNHNQNDEDLSDQMGGLHIAGSQSTPDRYQFNKNDLEIFLSTFPGMHWQKDTRVQLIIFKIGEELPRKSKVFENNGRHAEENAKLYLDEIEGVEKVIFVQNYGPCEPCAKLIDALSENITVEVVYTKIYKEHDNGLETLQATEVTCYQVTNWRWNAFLLWNAGSLSNDIHWWRMSYEDCEDAMARGLEQQRLQEKGSFGVKCEDDLEKGLQNAGIEYVHSRNCMEELLKKLVYKGNDMTNIKRYKAVEPLSIKQYVKEVFQRQ